MKRLNVWLVYYKDRAELNRGFIAGMTDTASKKNINMELVYVEDIHERLLNSSPDAVISRYINPALSKLLESKGIKVINNSRIARICNNKALTVEAVCDINSRTEENIIFIPTAVVSKTDKGYEHRFIYNSNKYIDKIHDSEIYKTDIYNNKLKYLEQYINSYHKYPDSDDYVVKSVTGHGGKEVYLLSDYVKNMPALGNQEYDATCYYSERFIIQPKIDCGNRDLRVYVIGHEIIGAVLRTSDSGFKSNYSLGGSVSLYELSESQIKIVNCITDQFDFDYVGIDFLLGKNDELIFNEIEDVVGARMLSECSDIDYISLFIDRIILAISSL